MLSHSRIQPSLKQARHSDLFRSRQRGVGVIEVLIALVIVSFGVLGMAGLQLTGIKHSASGFTRSKALMLTENMAARMRINPTGAIAGAYAPFDSATLACDVKPDPYCQASAESEAESCNTDELAAFDLFSVVCGDLGENGAIDGVRGLLPPNSQLTISCSSGAVCDPEDVFILSVTWPEKGNASSTAEDEMRQVQMRLRP